MSAKMKGKPYREESRPDWFQVRVKIMRWCLRVKLAQHWSRFGELLLQTDDRQIVEESHKDDFWGAKPVDRETLVGTNALGRLLMELREELKTAERELLTRVEPLPIPDFLLNGEPISVVTSPRTRTTVATPPIRRLGGTASPRTPQVGQMYIFKQKDSMKGALGNRSSLIENLKPYPEYKDSGLPWLGVCPAHWSQRRMKFLFTERVQKGFYDEPLLAATQTKGVIRKEDYDGRTVTAQKDFHLLKLVEVGDFVISLRSFQGGIEVAHCRGIISPAYTILTPKRESRLAYFTHFFKSPDFIRSLSLFVTGIREGQNIDYVRLSRAYLPLPPEDEQEAIGRFLDYANQRIERAIKAKKKLIALLNEQKQVIIHRAVTRGLARNVPLKPSGLPWLADIPKHWETRPLKRLLLRMDYGTSESARGEGKIRVLTMGHIRNGKVSVPEEGGLDAIPPGLLLETNDLLFNRTNSPDLVGKVGLFTDSGSELVTFASYLVRLRIRPEHSPHWLNYMLNSSRFWAYARSQALISLHQANLNSTRYGQMAVPVPPEQEQREIVNYVNNKVAGIERAIQRTEREIELLREYRMRLVAEVVTGKFDVRDGAANLPEQVAESEPTAIDAEPDEEAEELVELEESNG